MQSWFFRDKHTLWLILLLLVLTIGTALLVMLPIRGSNLASGTAGWTQTGCFKPGAVYPTTYFDRQITAHERQGATVWGSHCGSDASTGKLQSPSFEAPTILELFVAGYLSRDRPDLQLFLERADGQHRVPVPVSRLAGEAWVKLRWWTPAELRGQQVRLIAIDDATSSGGWLGVSNPRRLSVFNFYRQQLRSWVRVMATYLFQLALFLLPGFAAASVFMRKRKTPLAPIYLVTVVICTGAVLGYFSFWAFFFSKGFGRFLSFALYLGAAGLLAACPRAAMKTTARLIYQPFLYVTLAGLCYISFYFIFSEPFSPGIGYASDRFFADILAGDNVIPAVFADKIYDRKPIRPFCCDDWLSSDRPPLQTGIVLMERPLGLLNNTELTYQLLSSALQCFWICGVWCLLTALGTSQQRIRQVLGFLIFSGFLLYNSLYTWPKLLSATCILFLLSILFDIALAKRAFTYFEAALAATCLGLALMAHPGSTFSLAVFAVLLLRLRSFFTWRQVALAFAIVMLFYLPWSAYQKYVDPPGNRLLKMHLGGVIPVDSRTAWPTIRDSYHSHSWPEIVKYKWSNIEYLAGKDFLDSYGLTATRVLQIDHAATEKSRTAQRVYMWNAVGLANAGWLAGLFLLLKRRRTAAIPYSVWLIAAALTNVVFWSVVTFGPYETQTAHSSYADILLLSVGLLGFLLALPRIFFLLLFAWQLFNFFVVWVWSLPARIAQPIAFQWPMLVSGVVLTLILVWLTLKKEEPVLI